MIKVCHITSAHGEEDVRIFHKECVSLAKNGYEVYLVQRGESYEKNGVKLAGFGEVPSGRIKRILLASRIAHKKALEIDAHLYHSHDPDLLPYGEKPANIRKHLILHDLEILIRHRITLDHPEDIDFIFYLSLVGKRQKEYILLTLMIDRIQQTEEDVRPVLAV